MIASQANRSKANHRSHIHGSVGAMLSAVACVLLAFVFEAFAVLAGSGGAVAAEGAPGPAFSLVDQNGRRVTQADLSDRPVLLHFGFTSCPAICPTTLYEVAERMRELGPQQAARIHFVFVSVDPERDTPEMLKTFVGSFDERIIALSGSGEQVAALARGLGARFEKVPGTTDGDYTMDHSVNGYLLSRGWRQKGSLYFGADSRADKALGALRELIGEGDAKPGTAVSTQ